ncbi:hypothetical protein COP2_023641 [Malus domestica]
MAQAYNHASSVGRGLSNHCWLDCWPNTSITPDTVVGSDHCLLIIQRDPNQAKCRKRFRFEAFWAKEEDYKQVITTCWHSACNGDPVSRW